MSHIVGIMSDSRTAELGKNARHISEGGTRRRVDEENKEKKEAHMAPSSKVAANAAG